APKNAVSQRIGERCSLKPIAIPTAEQVKEQNGCLNCAWITETTWPQAFARAVVHRDKQTCRHLE
ncbi:MAG TPA: hypothetical protein VM260_21485, partial [Pirellula sp.]|nr:hypothetical protein [Pirellula sp.]